MSVNLFSDTQTQPTEAMREAMAEAEVADEQRSLDPTVNALQERVAELLGHEAALFLPSGTMCNLIGFRLHLRPGGDEVILDRTSHPVNFEAGSPGFFSGAMVEKLDGDGGRFTAEQVEAAVRPPGNRYAPRSRLVSVEQTTNIAGGRVWPLEQVRGVLEVARRHELRAHLDGARLMNAVVATRRARRATGPSGFDTAWIDFTKGLGAPVGRRARRVAELIEEAWRWKQGIGGALRQAGVIAAGCLYALDHHVERLAEDHENARLLAEGLAELPGVEIDPATVDTNIVVFTVADAFELTGRLHEQGIEVGPLDARRVRAVTHLDVDRAGVERALAALSRRRFAEGTAHAAGLVLRDRRGAIAAIAYIVLALVLTVGDNDQLRHGDACPARGSVDARAGHRRRDPLPGPGQPSAGRPRSTRPTTWRSGSAPIGGGRATRARGRQPHLVVRLQRASTGRACGRVEVPADRALRGGHLGGAGGPYPDEAVTFGPDAEHGQGAPARLPA